MMLGNPRPNESRIANNASSGAYDEVNNTRRAATVNMTCSSSSTEEYRVAPTNPTAPARP